MVESNMGRTVPPATTSSPTECVCTHTSLAEEEETYDTTQVINRVCMEPWLAGPWLARDSCTIHYTRGGQPVTDHETKRSHEFCKVPSVYIYKCVCI